jgi:hypothetical protein
MVSTDSFTQTGAAANTPILAPMVMILTLQGHESAIISVSASLSEIPIFSTAVNIQRIKRSSQYKRKQNTVCEVDVGTIQ